MYKFAGEFFLNLYVFFLIISVSFLKIAARTTSYFICEIFKEFEILLL